MAEEAGSVVVQIRGDDAQLTRALRQSERAARASGQRMQSSVDKVHTSFARVSTAAIRTNGSLDKFGRATNQTTGAIDKTTTAVNGATHAYGRMYTRLGGVTLAMRSMLGPLAGAYAIFAGFQVLRDFSVSMAQVEAITKSTSSEMELLSAKARELGASTEFTAAQAADAMVFLGRAGFSTKEILDAITDTLNLSTAAQVDLATASNITANILRTFQIPANQVAKVTDVLAAASAAANTDVTLLGDSMKYVGPIAQAAHISLNNVAAAAAALADAGIIGSQAGAGLRRVLGALANPTKEAERALQSMGLTIKDVDPTTHSLVDIFSKLHDKGLDVSRALAIASQRGGTVLVSLANNVPRLQQLTAALSDVTGEALRQATVIRDQLGQDWKTLVSAVQEFFLAAGAAGATSALRATLQSLTTAVRFLADNMEALKTIAAGAVAYLGIRLVAALAAARLGFVALTAAMVRNPFGLLAVAIAGALSVLVEYRNATINVGQTTLRVSDFISAAWTTVAESIKGVVSWIYHLSKALGDLLTLDFTSAMKSASEAGMSLQRSGQAIFDAWKTALHGINQEVEAWNQAYAGMRAPPRPGQPLAPSTPAEEANPVVQTGGKNAFQQTLESIQKQTEALQIQARTMNMATVAAAEYEAKQQLLNAAKRAGITISAQQAKQIDQLAAAYAQATQAVEENKRAIEAADQARQTLSDTFTSFAKDLAHGVSLTDALTNALGRLADKLIEIAVNNLVQSALGPLGSPLGGAGATRTLGGLLGGLLIPGVLHEGGRVGTAPRGPALPAHYFTGAPRFAAGLGQRAPGINEVPILAKRGELVGWPNQMQAAFGGGGARVNIVNNNDFRGADPGTEARMKAYVDASSRQTVAAAVQAVARVRANNPNYLRPT